MTQFDLNENWFKIDFPIIIIFNTGLVILNQKNSVRMLYPLLFTYILEEHNIFDLFTVYMFELTSFQTGLGLFLMTLVFFFVPETDRKNVG